MLEKPPHTSGIKTESLDSSSSSAKLEKRPTHRGLRLLSYDALTELDVLEKPPHTSGIKTNILCSLAFGQSVGKTAPHIGD